MQARPADCCRPIAPVVGIGFCLPLLVTVSALSADDPFAESIRKTDPLPPAQEQKTFHLPPGFEIQLVAAEPDIAKPMNLAFDARGRLWITESREYPFAAPINQPGRDAIKILSHFDKNGRARKIQTFADGLNIPIGLLPYRDGVIAFSIPNLYYFADTNHDGRADTKEIILGRIGFEKDTHGLTSSFRRGYDGWIYADHGFNNDTTLTAKDSSSIRMNSGNTYRFLPDGSHVEQFTWGQVNPFGLMFDPLGDLWSADCHSSPVYQLLRGGYYPSFGKPNDGLGFAPNICAHQHGSTAIAGMVFYAATNFPPEFRGNTFVGNVMTCRINRDSLTEHGSTRRAKEEPDFLRCDDPWFRPVDLQLGPDGALYVADFYNRIIGHYEVPLDHPGRDRERGRIWRIAYVGPASSRSRSVGFQPAQSPDLTRASTSRLIAELRHPNLARRMPAMNELVDRIGTPAVRPVQKALRHRKSTAEQKVHGLWILHRLGALDETMLLRSANDTNRAVRVHVLRVLSESQPSASLTSDTIRRLLLRGLSDSDPYVQRAAIEALGQHPILTAHDDFTCLDSLLKLRQQIPEADSQLVHACRMALRNHLKAPGAFSHLESLHLDEPRAKLVADIAPGVPTGKSAAFLFSHVQRFSEPHDKLTTYLRHTARHVPEAQFDELASFIRQRFADDLELQFTLFKSVQDGLAQRDGKVTAGLRAWAADLVEKLLAPLDDAARPWLSSPLNEAPTDSPWILQTRKSADGVETNFLSSLAPDGETLTGTLRSRAFTIPPRLSFFLAGHDGFPDKPPGKKNFVRLIAADSAEVFTNAAPPRNDLAQPIAWDLSAAAGQRGVLEIVDSDTGTGFAWLAAGRFDPPVVPLPQTSPNQLQRRPLNAAELTRTVPLSEFAPRFVALLRDAAGGPEVRAAAARTLLALDSTAHVPLAAALLADANQPAALRESLAQLLAGQNSAEALAGVAQAIPGTAQRLQIKIAGLLAGNTNGVDLLLSLVEERKLPPQVIADRTVKEKMNAARMSAFKERYEKLIAGLPSVNAELQKHMDERRKSYNANLASTGRGRAVFEKSCAVCHQLGGQGAVVGPQLDGIGNRGLERLLEDVLDPNRNVDPAFRPSLVTLKDDTSVTGLLRREEGELLVFVDTQGKEINVPRKEIAERRESQLSLMPANFGEVLKEDEFNDLLAFLLAHGAK